MKNTVKLLIIQRAFQHYRAPVFQKLSEVFDLTVFAGKGTATGGNKNDQIRSFGWGKELPSVGRYFEIGARGYYLPLFPTLIKEIDKGQFDVIITEGTTNLLNNLLLFFNRHKVKAPIIWWDAGRRESAPINPLRVLVEPMLRWMIRHSQSCLAYGTTAKGYFDRLAVPANQVYIAWNAQAADKACAEPFNRQETEALRTNMGLTKKKVLLCAGALEKRKKIDQLLRLVHVLNRKDIALLLLGDGCDEERLKRLTHDLNIQDQVRFAGRTIADRGPYFQMADVYIIPSKYGCVHTPMWYGKPVVVNKYNCDVELVQHGVNGFICADNDLAELGVYVNKLLDEPGLGQRFGASGRNMIAEKANLDQMVQGIMNAVHGTMKQDSLD